ncbi:MAG: 50S ribosomal protein L24 [Candidatus Improbicoccus pseudotrichonymphae]|uniref:Large ribosomal subunit protein uL24 n=1 Tax=Candidatus Improbicoccus pseudotrichonymphae TaxID=3033792 RepID=A0AA48KYU1_9FIRM|nr:MAG: 50S ribosomal protein L24 [Candidatus Improbicoccus pseudotrichonymphae]
MLKILKKCIKGNKVHVRRGDTVAIISGKDKGKRGKVLAVSLKESKIMVSGVKIVSKHAKARNQSEESGIIKTEGAFYSCKAQLVCPHCNQLTRIMHVFENNKKHRSCKKCRKII